MKSKVLVLVATSALAVPCLAFDAFGLFGIPPIGEAMLREVCCKASGVDCLFGSAGGCVAVCGPGQNCTCKGAKCNFGFPAGAECSCESGGA